MQTSLLHLRQNNAYWRSASGRGLLAWEQRVLDAFAQQVFGFYALSFALGSVDALRSSTIHHLIRTGGDTAPAEAAGASSGSGAGMAAQFDIHDWPFQNDSLDYIALPHVLEFALDPHAVLREAARCLRPGGSLSLTAFNPHSLLGLQAGHTELGQRRDWLSRKRLIDWMALLNLHADKGAFGQWRPMSAEQQRFERLAWLDSAGERWWPQLSNVYALRMVKRLSPDLRQFAVKKESLFARVQRAPAAAAHRAPRSADTNNTP